MTRRDLPAYVGRYGRNKLLYFRRYGKLTRIHAEPGTPEFWAEYYLCLKGRAAPPPTRTIKGLVQRYKESTTWADLSANTRKSYTRHFAWLIDAAGDHDPSSIRKGVIYDMQQALSDKPTDANRKIAALSTLLTYAREIEWVKENPAIGVKQLKPTGRKREPWPLDMIEAFRADADPRTRLIFELLLGTGQRIGDVLRMQWGHIDGDGISVTQGKTKAKIYVPFTEAVRETLASAPRRGLYIVTQDNGRPVSYNLAWRDVMDVRRRIGAEAWDIHGLRHSAAAEIASLPGMTSDHVRAITGHSSAAMVRLYAGPAMQKARAKEAQKARENKTATKRESAIGSANARSRPLKTNDKSEIKGG